MGKSAWTEGPWGRHRRKEGRGVGLGGTWRDLGQQSRPFRLEREVRGSGLGQWHGRGLERKERVPLDFRPTAR